MDELLQSLGSVNPAKVVGGPKAGAATQLPTAESSPPQVVAAPVNTGRFAVKLKDCARFVVEAKDRLHAIEIYKHGCGILRTENEFDVEEVDEPAFVFPPRIG